MPCIALFMDFRSGITARLVTFSGLHIPPIKTPQPKKMVEESTNFRASQT